MRKAHYLRRRSEAQPGVVSIGRRKDANHN